MYSIPFSVGLQIISAEDYGNGRGRPWKHNNGKAKIDARAKIEEAFQ